MMHILREKYFSVLFKLASHIYMYIYIYTYIYIYIYGCMYRYLEALLNF